MFWIKELKEERILVRFGNYNWMNYEDLQDRLALIQELTYFGNILGTLDRNDWEVRDKKRGE